MAESDSLTDSDGLIKCHDKAIGCYFPSMPISVETLKQDLDQLTPAQLQQVADFIAFLKFRDQLHDQPRRQRVALDPTELANLFAEFAAADRALAETGLNDGTPMQHQEDPTLAVRMMAAEISPKQ